MPDRTAAEQLADIFDGDPPPGADLLIPQLAKQLLAEHGTLRARIAADCAQRADYYNHPEIWKPQSQSPDAIAARAMQQAWSTAARLIRSGEIPAEHVQDGEPDAHPPHQVTVTSLPPGFDHSDQREYEYIVGNDTAGWTSHQVEHPDACHALPYGRVCWLDENWYDGPYRYDEVEPGTYRVTLEHQDIGDHRGEYSHTEQYVHYERTGDASERPAKPEPVGGYSDGAPF